MVGAAYNSYTGCIEKRNSSKISYNSSWSFTLQITLLWYHQRVIYDGTYSESQPVVCGVPQGSILGYAVYSID